MTSRVAAFDCGTNSLRLLVADVDPAAGTLVDLDRRMEVVRLGAGVDRRGRFDPVALERTLAAVEEYAGVARALGAERVRMVATSATRDAADRSVFVDGVRARLGVEPEVVDGAEEAALSYAGAARELGGEPQPVLAVDIGGGSTELVLGTVGAEGPERAVEAARSVDVGCVRLHERHLATDPPTADEVAAAEADVAAALDAAAAGVPLSSARTLVGLAGSVTTVTAHALGLPAYRPERIHRARLPRERLETACTSLLGMTRAERAALPYLHPGRVDVIGAGALVWRAVLRRVGLPEALTSEHDILDGIAWSLVEQR